MLHHLWSSTLIGCPYDWEVFGGGITLLTPTRIGAFDSWAFVYLMFIPLQPLFHATLKTLPMFQELYYLSFEIKHGRCGVFHTHIKKRANYTFIQHDNVAPIHTTFRQMFTKVL